MKPAFPGDERYERERPRDRGAFFNLEKLKSFAKKPDTWKLIALSMVLGLVITYAIVVHVSDSAELVPGNQTKKSGAKPSGRADPFEADSAHCPTVFYGAGCKQSKYLPDCAGTKPFEEYLTMTVGDPWPRIDDETHALLPKKDVFGRPPGSRAAVPSCALVSNGGMLTGKGLGREIDEHNIVMRMNNAPTKGYEADVGSKTDIRFSNANYEGWREVPTEAVIGEHWNLLEFEAADGDAENFTAAAGKQLKRVLKKKVHPLNHKIYSTLTESHFFHDQRDTHLLLMHACEKVHLYGFNTQQSIKEQGYRSIKNWYFDKRSVAGGKPIPIPKWARWEDTTYPDWHSYPGPLQVAQKGKGRRALLERALGSRAAGNMGAFGVASVEGIHSGPAPAAAAAFWGVAERTGGTSPGWEQGATLGSTRRRLRRWHDPEGELMCMMKLRSQGFVEMTPAP